MQNPLFPTDQSNPTSPVSGATGPAAMPADDTASRLAAAELIRQKVAAPYGEAPGVKEELAKAAQPHQTVSRHQAYMQQLRASGKSLVEIQAAWHAYYAQLPDSEKHEVWREFHASSSGPASTPAQQAAQQPQPARPNPAPVQTTNYQAANASQVFIKPIQEPAQATPATQAAPTTQPVTIQPVAAPQTTIAAAQPAVPQPQDVQPAQIKQRVLETVNAGGKLKKKHHLQSLGFGLATGLVSVFIFLFSFFNEVFISPFVQPSRRAGEIPVIVDPASAVVGQTPKVIIPKINVEIPVDYTQTSIDDKAIEAALDNGVVHYPTTVKPGQPGNSVFFGHSSNNIFNSGKYKFAFVLLHELREGDTFYLTNEGKAYAYKVVIRRVVEPTEVSVLGPVDGYGTTATLITCDPPGTSLKRLVVVGEQISPAPDETPAPGTVPAPPAPILSATENTSLPGNGPTLWGRLWNSVF